MEILDHGQARTGPFEGLEEQTHHGLHLGIRIENNAILRIVQETDRHHLLELAAPRTAQDAPAQTRLEHVQLRFAHRALESQQQAIVEVRRVVEPVLIEDEGIGERAQLEQPMPVGGVSRQARDLKAEHDPDATQTYFGHQLLEALAIGGARPRLPQIAVDDHDAIEWPPQLDRALASAYWR